MTTVAKEFPKQQPGLNYLTEGGQETEIMYKYGFDLPHFAVQSPDPEYFVSGMAIRPIPQPTSSTRWSGLRPPCSLK